MYKRQSQSWLKHIDFILIDVLALQLAFVFAYMLRHDGSLPYAIEAYRTLAVIITLLDMVVAAFFNTMHNVLKRGYYLEFINTIVHVLLVFLATALYLFAIKQSADYSRIAVFLTSFFHLVIGYILRILWKRELKHIGIHSIKQSMIVVAPEARISEILSKIGLADDHIVKGIVFSDRNAKGETIEGINVVANLSDAADYICREWVDDVFVCLNDNQALDSIEKDAERPGNLVADNFSTFYRKDYELSLHEDIQEDSIATLIEQCRQMSVTVHIWLPLSNIGGKTFVQKVCGTNVITTTTNYASSRELAVKRIFDIAGALIGSMMAVIIILIFGPAIMLQSPGPVIFTQTRIGQNGRKFKIYKLRTMYVDAEERKREYLSQNRVSDDMMFKLDFDPRVIGNRIVDGRKVTGLGDFLRRSSLDEFPQFFNVLLNQMSLVGTRPPTEDEWERYKYHHRARLATKPGMTGLWQVSGRSEITNFEEVVKLDTEYINNWNPGLDMRILIKTIKVVIKRAGAV